MMAETLESVIRYARTKLLGEMAESDDKTEGIACRGLVPVYVQNKQHEVGGSGHTPGDWISQRVHSGL